MAKAYSVDLRLKALNLLEKGKTVKEVVVLLKISKSSIYSAVQYVFDTFLI